MWSIRILKDLEDPDLKELAAKLPDTILCSRADSTVKKYLVVFKRWKAWAKQHGMTAMPAKEIHVALYLQHLGDTSQSKAAVEGACNALACHRSSITTINFVKATLEGMQRILAKLTVKKNPVTSVMLEDMVKDVNESNTLADLRLTTASLLAYVGFLRFNELVNIRPCNITRHEGMMIIHLPCSKMNQLRKGDEVAIAQTGYITCPVAMLETYMLRTSMGWNEERLLFRPIYKTGKMEKVRESGSISYSCL